MAREPSGPHEGYIAWHEYWANQQRLARNRTCTEATVLSGPAREGLVLGLFHLPPLNPFR